MPSTGFMGGTCSRFQTQLFRLKPSTYQPILCDNDIRDLTSEMSAIVWVHCVEYRDMVPKTKAGLSGTWADAISRSPTVPATPANHLDLFYNIHFPSFKSSVSWVGNLAFQIKTATVPSVIVHCHLFEAVHQLNLPACIAWATVWKQSLVFMS